MEFGLYRATSVARNEDCGFDAGVRQMWTYDDRWLCGVLQSTESTATAFFSTVPSMSERSS